MKRGALELGLAGFEIGPFVQDWNLDDPRFDPLYTMAEELNMSLFVHPVGTENQGRKGHYMLTSLVAMPAETASAIACILMGGVLERHPKLRFCFAHGGGSYPFIKVIAEGYCRLTTSTILYRVELTEATNFIPSNALQNARKSLPALLGIFGLTRTFIRENR